MNKQFHVISGYRSPETNAKLRQQSKKVAKRSYHMLGKAIDIRLPGVPLKALGSQARALQVGGVGYYQRSNFIHVDVGHGTGLGLIQEFKTGLTSPFLGSAPGMARSALNGTVPYARWIPPNRVVGARTLGIPTVMDRLIQLAIHQVLSPLYDPGFSAQSYGCRPGRNAWRASISRTAHGWVVDLDLETFFDQVNHDILMSWLARRRLAYESGIA